MSPRSVLVRNLIVVSLPELLWGFASALTIEAPIPAAYRGYLCGGEGFLGTWALVSALASACAMLLTGWYVLPFARKRAFVVIGHLVTGALYLPVYLLARALGDGESASPAGALLGIGLFSLSLGLLMPAWMALLGTLFPEGQRSRVLGLVFVLNRLGGVLGGLFAERVLSTGGDPHAQWAWLWGIAALTAFLGGVPFFWVKEVPGTPLPRPPLGAYLGRLLSGTGVSSAVRRFLAIDLLLVAGFVLAAYYGDRAFVDRGVDPDRAGGLTAATAFAQMLGALLVALLGGRLRPRRGLALGAVCAAAAAVLACVVTTYAGFLLVAALLGGFLVARQTCHGPQLMRLDPAADPTPALSLGMAVAAAGQALLPFAAGQARGSVGFTPLFIVVATACTLSAVLFMTRVGDGPSNDVTTS